MFKLVLVVVEFKPMTDPHLEFVMELHHILEHQSLHLVVDMVEEVTQVVVMVDLVAVILVTLQMVIHSQEQ
tara:strand:+ start:1007 stop:1219 length:213 start_codon:yes stop_codon:yes gene_type:complete